MLQPHPCLHEFKKRGQSLVFMMTIQLTQREFSQHRTPHGPQSSSQFNWQHSQSSSAYRDYNGGLTSQDDDSNNRLSGRPSYSHNYQQEFYRGNGNSRGYYQSESYSEPESEWMQFGPSSQTEFMEFNEEDKDVRV